MDRSVSQINQHALALWKFNQVFDPIQDVDVMICLGSYDLRVAERCAELLLGNVCQKSIVTGAFGNWTAGKFDRPEADIFADEIARLGVYRDRLILERAATNIGENIRNSKDLLGSEAIRQVLFITKPQTQLRVKATAARQWPEITPLVTAPDISFAEQARGAGSEANLINEMVGDIERLLSYPSKGFQAEVSIPDDIIRSYEFLKTMGYDKHCLGGVAAG